MAKYLLTTDVKYRVDTEEEAKNLIETAKTSGDGDLVKYSCDYKTQKSKGEIVQEWWEVKLSRYFTDAKEPYGATEVEYVN